jgi:hypothetical protein
LQHAHLEDVMRILQNGNCERVKTGVHASVLGLAVVCGLYNAAAWLSRRQVHLAVNFVLYAMLVAWEHQHVLHHLAELQPTAGGSATQPEAAAVPPSLAA